MEKNVIIDERRLKALKAVVYATRKNKRIMGCDYLERESGGCWHSIFGFDEAAEIVDNLIAECEGCDSE